MESQELTIEAGAGLIPEGSTQAEILTKEKEDSMTTKARQELYTGIGVVVIAVLAYLVAIPAGIVVPDDIEIRALSPDFWPLIVVAVLGLAGISLIFQGLAGMGLLQRKQATSGAGQAGAASKDEGNDALPLAKAAPRVAIFILCLFLIYFAISLIGMVATTIPALLFLAWFAGERRWKIIVPLAILLPVVLYIFFVYVANVPIPNGIFENLG